MSCDCLDKLEAAAIRANLANGSRRWFEELTDIIQAAKDNRGPYAVREFSNPLPQGGNCERVWISVAAAKENRSRLEAWETWAKEVAVPALNGFIIKAHPTHEGVVAFDALLKRPKD